jgi:hypothetical protein
MVYSESVMEAIKFKLHNSGNNTTIAREIKNEFNLPMEVETLRKTISRIRERYKIKPNTRIKRLFFDIETGYYTCRLWHIGKVGYVSPDTIISDKPIICISYKWQDEDVVHNLDWSMGEKEMLQSFVSILHEASEVVGHNSDRFDLREIRTKCLYYGIPIPPEIRSLDTLKKSREYFNFASNKLDYIGKYLNLGKKLPHEGFQLWVDVVENKKPEALQKMIAYCNNDVVLLEDVYHALAPYITHNNNFGTLLGGNKHYCPECASNDVILDKTYTTATGTIKRRMRCNKCGKYYVVSNKTYVDFLQETLK